MRNAGRNCSSQLAHLAERSNKESISKGETFKYIMKETELEKGYHVMIDHQDK